MKFKCTFDGSGTSTSQQVKCSRRMLQITDNLIGSHVSGNASMTKCIGLGLGLAWRGGGNVPG